MLASSILDATSAQPTLWWGDLVGPEEEEADSSSESLGVARLGWPSTHIDASQETEPEEPETVPGVVPVKRSAPASYFPIHFSSSASSLDDMVEPGTKYTKFADPNEALMAKLLQKNDDMWNSRMEAFMGKLKTELKSEIKGELVSEVSKHLDERLGPVLNRLDILEKAGSKAGSAAGSDLSSTRSGFTPPNGPSPSRIEIRWADYEQRDTLFLTRKQGDEYLSKLVQMLSEEERALITGRSAPRIRNTKLYLSVRLGRDNCFDVKRALSDLFQQTSALQSTAARPAA